MGRATAHGALLGTEPLPTLLAAAVAVAALGGIAASAADHEVGPGKPYAAIGDVPWEALAAGDRVLIHWRQEPYREKWVINARGTAEAPIVIRGVAGPGGELPLIDGRNATTRQALDYWNEERGVLEVGGSSVPADGLPAHLVLENLEIRSGRPPYTFSDDQGAVRANASNAASIYVEKAEHLRIRNCVLHDSGNGLFIGAFDGLTQDILIEGTWIHDNGIEGSGYQHNAYTAAIGIVYQYNRFGPLREGAEHRRRKVRPDDGSPDLGALERCPDHRCPLFADGFESGNSSAWSAAEEPPTERAQ